MGTEDESGRERHKMDMGSIKSVHGGCNLVLSHFASKDLSVYFQGLHAFEWAAKWT